MDKARKDRLESLQQDTQMAGVRRRVRQKRTARTKTRTKRISCVPPFACVVDGLCMLQLIILPINGKHPVKYTGILRYFIKISYVKRDFSLVYPVYKQTRYQWHFDSAVALEGLSVALVLALPLRTTGATGRRRPPTISFTLGARLSPKFQPTLQTLLQ